jgi:hypothetical protein
MSTEFKFWRWAAFCSPLVVVLILTAAAADMPQDKPTGRMVPLVLKLPEAAFKGTRPDSKENAANPFVEPYPDKPRPPMMVPAGLMNLAAGPAVKLTTSDKNATTEGLAKVTDGNKDANEDAILLLRKGTQWVQLDFGDAREIFAVVIWHAHDLWTKIFRDVVVQVADDANFTANVRTLFNNDRDNSSGLGAGTDLEYYETREGKLINAKGVKGRYLRCYTRGSTENALNQYTEIEVYGRPCR